MKNVFWVLNEFSLELFTFHGNVSQFLVSLTVNYSHFSCHHNSRIGFSKQNVYVNELNIVLLYTLCSDEFKYRYNLSNLYWVTHDNGGWRRLSMVIATERCWVERLSCKGSRTWEIKVPKNKLHQNMISSGNIALTGVHFQSHTEQRCSILAPNLGAYEKSLRNTYLRTYILRNSDE